MSDARFDRLLREHEAVVRRLAHSYERDPARRQDLVQEIWLAVWQALPRFRGDARSGRSCSGSPTTAR